MAICPSSRRAQPASLLEENSVSDTIQGLTITAVGMGLVFLALGIVLLTMILLQKIFPQKAAARNETAQENEAEPAAAPAEAVLASEKVAAISVALAYVLAEERAGATPVCPSAWAAIGRSRQLNQPLARERKR